MGYNNNNFVIYVDSKNFYSPVEGDITTIDVKNGRLQLMFTTYGKGGVPRQIYEFAYNMTTHNLDYVDKGVSYY